jgi:hypothetical protein
LYVVAAARLAALPWIDNVGHSLCSATSLLMTWYLQQVKDPAKGTVYIVAGARLAALPVAFNKI